MAKLDLDAVHKARQEQAGDPHELTLDGKTFLLPASPPAAVLVGLGRMQSGDLTGLETALRSLFGDELDGILEAGFDAADLEPIFEEFYGFDMGESEASPS